MNTQLRYIATLVSRLLLSIIFIQAGWGKLHNFSATQGFMESMSIPGILLPAVILLELGGGLAILLGFSTRAIAAILSIFSVVSGFIFHFDPNSSGQMIHFYKNVALAGGFLALCQIDPIKWSLDFHLRALPIIKRKNLEVLFS
ncbi:DoxX family protein [Vibrio lamellibrachiae]|uniref:DoxX family protein n=1 Tax=Vibrio lamellibrachiae TaxID=2910253 RepID=UPI003D0A6A8A